MDTTLIQDATIIDASTMSVPQPAPEPMQISKEDILYMITRTESAIADLQGQLDEKNAVKTQYEALLAQAESLGLKTGEEIQAENPPEDGGVI